MKKNLNEQKKPFADPVNYYQEQGLITNPDRYIDLYSTLPGQLPELCDVVQGLLLHDFWADRYGERLSEERKKQVGIRHLKHILPQILSFQDDPLDQTRSLDKRFIGNCRTFSVMLTSFLRHQGIPARARCGFGAYFSPGKFEDHWVCEYWNQTQDSWILVDAQLDEFQIQELKVDFDPLDVPRNQFIVAGKAWNWCRAGEQDPEKFGIFDMHGLWFIRGNLVRDVAALNKFPLLPWDGWGLADQVDEDLTNTDLKLLDQVGAQTWDEIEYQSLRSIYTSETGFTVPSLIKSYTQSGTLEIDLETEEVINRILREG